MAKNKKPRRKYIPLKLKGRENDPFYKYIADISDEDNKAHNKELQSAKERVMRKTKNFRLK